MSCKTINNIKYPDTKEFSEMTGISVSTLNRLVLKWPWTTIKFEGFRLWDVKAFYKEFEKGRGLLPQPNEIPEEPHPGPKRKLRAVS